MALDWIQEAPLALEAYAIWIGVAGAFLLFGLGWFLGARIKARQIREIERQTERRISKLVEKADRERKARFLEEKNRWYTDKAKFERELDHKRRHLDRLSEEFQEKEGEVAERSEAVQQRGRELNGRDREVRQREGRVEQRDRELDGGAG